MNPLKGMLPLKKKTLNSLCDASVFLCKRYVKILIRYLVLLKHDKRADLKELANFLHTSKLSILIMIIRHLNKYLCF